MPKRIIIDGISKYPPVEAIGKFARTLQPQVNARISANDGRQFGGKITATGIPTQYARAGILATAQELETAKTFASLIRID